MRPNILLITTDQQRFDTIRLLGNNVVYTPHLDLLAREGVIFTSAYSDCPMCIPARWSILVGKRAATLNHAYYQDGVRIPVKNEETLPGILTANGYQTQAIGKMHLLKSSELTGVFKKAGSIFGSTNITISDLLAVKKHLLGISTINQG